MEISLLQLKNANNKVAANRVRVFVALKRGLHGGSGAHVLLGYETQKLCIWIISSAQRGFLAATFLVKLDNMLKKREKSH